MIDAVALKSEILQGSAYKDAVKKGNDAAIAEALNARAEGVLISRGIVSKDEFIMALASGLAGIYGAPESDAAKKLAGWLKLLEIVTNIDTASPVVGEALAAAVSMGVCTKEEVEAALLRPGSQAEALFGRGTVATAADVSFALRGVR